MIRGISLGEFSHADWRTGQFATEKEHRFLRHFAKALEEANADGARAEFEAIVQALEHGNKPLHIRTEPFQPRDANQTRQAGLLRAKGSAREVVEEGMETHRRSKRHGQRLYHRLGRGS